MRTIIRDALGDFPMVGFFANGELNRDRIYACTGVLTLFLRAVVRGVAEDIDTFASDSRQG